MGKIKLLIKYLIYVLKRKRTAGHGIHSPFVFMLNREVLNSREKYDEYGLIRKFRSRLLKRSEIISVNDRGAGSIVFSSGERKVKDMVRNSSSSLSMGKLLFRLIRHIDARNVVELGTSLGFGTFCLSLGAANGKVYSLEACPAQLSIARDELAYAGADNVELIEGEFGENLHGLFERFEHVDLVYFDGDHRKEAVLWQFNQFLGKVTPGTILVIADINWSPDMNSAWKELCREPAVTLSVDLFHCGLLFFREGMTKQHILLGFI